MTSSHHFKAFPLALALGITWGLGMLILAWLSWWCKGEWGSQFIQTMSSIYVGYKANFGGGIIGFLWGFIDWFIGGLVIAWIYNGCSKCCRTYDIQP